MNSEEQAIYEYLKPWRQNFVSGREIARRVGGKKRFQDDPYWATPILSNMVTKEFLDTDNMGSFRVRQSEKHNKARRYIAPQLLRILKQSGKNFEGVEIDEIEDETPQYLPPSRSKTNGQASAHANATAEAKTKAK